MDSFLHFKLLIECELEYNIPIFTYQESWKQNKTTTQDLGAINKIAEDLRLVVTNLCALLTEFKTDHV